MIEVLLICSFVTNLIVITLLIVQHLKRKNKSLTFNQVSEVVDTVLKTVSQPQQIDMQPIYKQLSELPNKVLMSITNSTNTYKGALGELIGYINLRASYDRIIPLGSIVDFVAVKLPSDTHPGCVDFVDVKTGHKARLSKEQKALQKLIEEKKINFCRLKVEASDADHSPRS